MSQTQKISRNNTCVSNHADGSKSVTLHSTEVAHWNPITRQLRLCTGGWYTVTTRTRMSQAMNEWGIPVRIGFTKKERAAEVYEVGTGRTISKHLFDSQHICRISL